MKKLNLIERMLSVGLPITALLLAKYISSDQDLAKLINAYIFSQIAAVVIGSASFQAKFKKKNTIIRDKLFKIYVIVGAILAIGAGKYYENHLLAAMTAYQLIVPIEMNNVFKGKQILNLQARVASLTIFIIALVISHDVNLSLFLERIIFIIFLALNTGLKEGGRYPNFAAGQNLMQFQIYVSGVLVYCYSKIEQVFMTKQANAEIFINYVLILRLYDFLLLVINSIVLSRISEEHVGLRMVRKKTDYAFLGALIVSIILYFMYSGSFSASTFCLLIIINQSYYWGAWGVVKSHYTYHNERYLGNLYCQIFGVLAVAIYLLMTKILTGFNDMSLLQYAVIPLIGQITTNFVAPMLLPQEREFIIKITRG